MAYHTPIFLCGCGETFPLDVREKEKFEGICSRCKTKYVIELQVPDHNLVDPSRKGVKNA